ncbi:I78 family peptidase inhibitor [Paracoccus laeviglucosivorans]|uniref:Peptidase inhibitor I78 family protein n=1 Tax=Paracoccus laeviglucosivorans TaxID=1197861 RepID=A0A521BSA0_9RHOB|nr:I78 family peptidase inhibitor [Paracoccus laeviglucosivorans]SMO50038.1 Peptidase inhibitor I78 family protein [Paracoccus laeviglucosivorans]
MKRLIPVVVMLPLLASACVPEAPATDPIEPPPVANDTCGANAYLPLIGQQTPNISVPANKAYRSYKTGDPVTMDFNANRLNFEHDKTGKLVRVSCG